MNSSDYQQPEQRLPVSILSDNSTLGGGEDPGDDVLLARSGELERLLLLTIREPTTIALTAMYSLAFLVGFVGNVTAIRVLVGRRSRTLQGVSATRSLLINLAVCDLMVVCLCMPLTLGHTIYTAWVYGAVLCRAVPFVQAVSVSASVLSLTVISINRYYSVHSPLNARTFFTQRKIFWTILVVWLISSGICAPLLFTIRLDELRVMGITFPICRELWPQAKLKQVYNVLLFVTLYCIPVTFNLTISFLTGRRLWRASRHFSDFDPHGQAMHEARMKTRKKIAKMVVALVLLFAISWLPMYVTDMVIDHQTHPPYWVLQVRPFAQWLGLTNSSMNPICYCFLGDLYRSAKVIRSKYHQRMVSLLSSSGTAKLPWLFSVKRPAAGRSRGAVSEEVEDALSDWCSHTSMCESFSQMVSLRSLTEKTASECSHGSTDLQ